MKKFSQIVNESRYPSANSQLSSGIATAVWSGLGHIKKPTAAEAVVGFRVQGNAIDRAASP
jgi:hypothetical protein